MAPSALLGGSMEQLLLVGGLAGVAGIVLGVFGHSALLTSLVSKLPANAQADIAALKADVAALKAKAGL
jgi:hypothetical protein